MRSKQTNITLGTAGHIDHGKTALIKCLTGCDTDRLKAEKERGMSIDLGFAPCVVNEVEVGIVDVPGHENFIKTMVAGATSIDGVIFVVAADDGVMPQTREHLDILTLLGVEHGIVVLTKIDCVSSEEQELARQEVVEFLKGTFLEDAPVLPISSITGEGFDAFIDELKVVVAGIEPRRIDGLFRMPVERAFSAKGYGTVVAGIPISGRAGIGDEVVLLPGGEKGKIKGMQVYKRESDTVMAGQCAAISIPQLDYNTITRGQVISVDGYFSPERWFLCQLQLLDHDKLFLKNGQRVKFHTGTTEVTGAVYASDTNVLNAGEGAIVQVRTNEPIIAGPRDPFIVRSLSPAATIGGGVVVESIGRKLKRSHASVQNDVAERSVAVLMDRSFVEYCVKTASGMVTSVGELARRVKLPGEQLSGVLAELAGENKVVLLPHDKCAHAETVAAVRGELVDLIGEFHRGSPESPGIMPNELAEKSSAPRALEGHVIECLKRENEVVERNHRLALAGHRPQYQSEEQRLLEVVESLFMEQMFNPPSGAGVAELAKIPAAAAERIIRILVEHEQLVSVAKGVVFHREAIELARRRIVEHINEKGELQSVDFKYLIDTSRKYAIPLLDYFDHIGLTRRSGYTRHLKSAAQ